MMQENDIEKLKKYLASWMYMAESTLAWLEANNIRDGVIEKACFDTLILTKYNKNIIIEPQKNFYGELIKQEKIHGKNIFTHMDEYIKKDAGQESIEQIGHLIEFIARVEYEYEFFHMVRCIYIHESEKKSTRLIEAGRKKKDADFIRHVDLIDQWLSEYKQSWLMAVNDKIIFYHKVNQTVGPYEKLSTCDFDKRQVVEIVFSKQKKPLVEHIKDLEQAAGEIERVRKRGQFSFEMAKPDIKGWQENHHRTTSHHTHTKKAIEKNNKHIATTQLDLTLAGIIKSINTCKRLISERDDDEKNVSAANKVLINKLDHAEQDKCGLI